MDAVEERVEVQSTRTGDDDFSVHDAPAWKRCLQRAKQLREIARHGPLVSTAELHLVSIPENNGAEAVPLRLEEDVSGGRHLRHQLGQHGRNRWLDGEIHRRAVLPPGVGTEKAPGSYR